MKHNWETKTKEYEKEFDLGGGRFKFAEGQNKFRLVAEPMPVKGTYMGNTSVKFVAYILDRADKRVKLAFLPYTIYKAIAAIATSEDYVTDDIPMPYDIIVKATKAGTKEVEYNVIPGKAVPLTEKEQEDVASTLGKKPLKDVVKKLRDKEKDSNVDGVDFPHAEEEEQYEEVID